jgi:hypothetical protein
MTKAGHYNMQAFFPYPWPHAILLHHNRHRKFFYWDWQRPKHCQWNDLMIFLCWQREKGSQVGICIYLLHIWFLTEFSGPYNDLSIYASVFYQMILLARTKREVKIFLSSKEQKWNFRYFIQNLCASVSLVHSLPLSFKTWNWVRINEWIPPEIVEDSVVHYHNLETNNLSLPPSPLPWTGLLLQLAVGS